MHVTSTLRRCGWVASLVALAVLLAPATAARAQQRSSPRVDELVRQAAEAADLQAQVAHRKSLVEFDRSQQTTWQASGVTMVPASGARPAVGSDVP